MLWWKWYDCVCNSMCVYVLKKTSAKENTRRMRKWSLKKHLIKIFGSEFEKREKYEKNNKKNRLKYCSTSSTLQCAGSTLSAWFCGNPRAHAIFHWNFVICGRACYCLWLWLHYFFSAHILSLSFLRTHFGHWPLPFCIHTSFGLTI